MRLMAYSEQAFGTERLEIKMRQAFIFYFFFLSPRRKVLRFTFNI